ncbi:hypothetical protein GCM10010168_79400 [Actinoplanes ianthinogenes]|uniref:Uncharacterized protein n=1 Tax=Actinoplanes ianthinogenes TaxID=122358 RepID=A0ABM7LK51_9ACTN|nr:hypothetical protein [Actinoplanes ianthinogenes]BCJ39605.1 hypothetical protein Aiant_02620 [Actinoplanes ianthinogenes]GGR48593.1 hypothetical protein GCM10010168_79400 [Actinoplanes ianthinogenes]
MPFRPPPGHADPDPRFDPYRERAGVLANRGEPFGVLYLRLDTSWRHLGGHLWWRRWSEPREHVTGYLALNDGGFDDFVEDATTVAEELEHWDRGRLPYRGLLLTVEWLDDEGSRRARSNTFGLDASH